MTIIDTKKLKELASLRGYIENKDIAEAAGVNVCWVNLIMYRRYHIVYCGYALEQICKALGVDPEQVTAKDADVKRYLEKLNASIAADPNGLIIGKKAREEAEQLNKIFSEVAQIWQERKN